MIVVTVVIKYFIFDESWPISEVITNAIGLNSSIGRVTWYITFQFICYGILCVIGINKRIETIIAYFCSSLIIILFAIMIDSSALGMNMWGINVFSFQLGVLCAVFSDEYIRFMNRQSKHNHIRNICILLFGFIVLFVFCYFVLDNPPQGIIQYPLKSLISGIVAIGTLYVAFLLSLINGNKEKLLKPIRVLGNYSYEVFLVHGIIIYQFPILFERNEKIGIMFFILLTSVFSYVLHMIQLKMNRHVRVDLLHPN